MNQVDIVYSQYCRMARLLDYLEERADSGHDALIEKIFCELPRASRERRLKIRTAIGDLRGHVHNTSFVAMVGAFERVLFEAIRRASPAIRETVEANYRPGEPMHAYRSGFVRTCDDFYNLAGVKGLLDNDRALREIATELKNIIDYRDFLAHGERVKVANVNKMAATPTMDSTKALFDQIIRLL